MQAILFVECGQEQAFLKKAQNFGYSEVYLVYSASQSKKITSDYRKTLQNDSSLKMKFFLDAKNQKEAKIDGFDGIFQLGTRNAGLFSGVTHVYDNEYEEEKDFIHQRRSGVNQVVLVEMKKNNVTLVLNFAGLQTTNHLFRARLLGRLQQNTKLAQKKSVLTLPATIATTPSQLRSAADIVSLQHLLK